MLFGCASAPQPVTPSPPPSPPALAPTQIAKGGDPCDGGEVTSPPPESLSVGGGAPKVTSQPVMHVGQIHAAGPLDPVIARRVVKAAHARLEHCYEQALVGDPHLAGAVQGQLTIAADGATTQARFTGVDAGLDACLEEIARSLVFPAQSAETHVDLPIDVSRP